MAGHKGCLRQAQRPRPQLTESTDEQDKTAAQFCCRFFAGSGSEGRKIDDKKSVPRLLRASGRPSSPPPELLALKTKTPEDGGEWHIRATATHQGASPSSPFIWSNTRLAEWLFASPSSLSHCNSMKRAAEGHVRKAHEPPSRLL